MKIIKRALRNWQTLKKISDPSERYVAQQLLKNLPYDKYAVLNNLLLPYSGKIGSSQIDHLVISIYGIFCIETKSHLGWILGSKMRRLFTQVLYKKKYPLIPNPVLQNETHIRAIQELLGNIVTKPIINIVVFPRASKFIIDGYHNVGSVTDMIETIESYQDKQYKFEEAKRIILAISQRNMKDAYLRADHIQRVKSVYTIPK